MKGSMNGEEGGWGRVYIGLRRGESRMFYEYCKWGPQPLILLACVAEWRGKDEGKRDESVVWVQRSCYWTLRRRRLRVYMPPHACN